MARNSKGRSHISVMTVLPRRAFSWHEPGCLCEDCVNNNNSNKNSCQRNEEVLDREYRLVKMETRMTSKVKSVPASSSGIPGVEQGFGDELKFWQDKFNRLLESHRKLQKVNQNLEIKLLEIVDKYEGEKSSFTSDLSDLSSRLVSAHYTISDLEDEVEQYRSDCNLAVQLLRCKPSSFVAHKVSSLPCDLQEKVKTHIECREAGQIQLRQEASLQTIPKTICVPVTTSPPSNMLYSVNNCKMTTGHSRNLPDLVSASILARVLEERAKERTGQCNRCPCTKNTFHKATQTHSTSVRLSSRTSRDSFSTTETLVNHESVPYTLSNNTETDV